jgi:hypothetical protein
MLSVESAAEAHHESAEGVKVGLKEKDTGVEDVLSAGIRSSRQHAGYLEQRIDVPHNDGVRVDEQNLRKRRCCGRP